MPACLETVGAGFRCQSARAWARTPQVSFALASLWRLLAERRFSVFLFLFASATTAVWTCGLRRWLKAPVRKGMGSNLALVTRSAVFLRSACASCQAKSTTPAGLEHSTPGSAGRCLIHWATGPAARDRRFAVAFGRAACCAGVRRHRACHRSSTLLANPWGSVSAVDARSLGPREVQDLHQRGGDLGGRRNCSTSDSRSEV
jgi:hypothetical protein